MKKIFLAVLFLIPVTYIAAYNPADKDHFDRFQQIIQRRKQQFENIDFLKFALSNDYLDGHLYGLGTCPAAREIAQEIHERLQEQKNKQGNNYLEIGKSLPETPDKPIVHECATIEKRLRATGNAGSVVGKSNLAFFSANYDGETFFRNACPCEFYSKLSKEELEQLIKGTQPTGGWFSK